MAPLVVGHRRCRCWRARLAVVSPRQPQRGRERHLRRPAWSAQYHRARRRQRGRRSNRRKSNAKSASAYQGLRIPSRFVEEGYKVSAEDIRTNKVLVNSTPRTCKSRSCSRTFNSSPPPPASSTRQQNYEIQLNQNLSNIKAAEQKARFARMDFDKFLGDKVTQAIVDKLGLEQELATEQTNALARAAAVVASLPTRAESHQASAVTTNGTPSKAVLAVTGSSTDLPAPGASDLPATNQTVAVVITANEPPKPTTSLTAFGGH